MEHNGHGSAACEANRRIREPACPLWGTYGGVACPFGAGVIGSKNMLCDFFQIQVQDQVQAQELKLNLVLNLNFQEFRRKKPA